MDMTQPITRGGGVRSRVAILSLVGLLWGAGGHLNLTSAQASQIDAGAYLQDIVKLGEQALAASRAAEKATTVEEVKAGADQVFETVWGMKSGMVKAEPFGDVPAHGWKVLWQTSGAEFDSMWTARYGTKPPTITDPEKLGIAGRARYLRDHLEALAKDENTPAADRQRAERIAASLNNVIGWMRLRVGLKGDERQPRISLTEEWTSSPEFWNSTADTGWLYEAYSQAVNIMKTDYEGDVEMARKHAADMTRLIEKYLNGVDADNDGTVEPEKMEGGLYTALREAESAGLVSR